MFDLGEWVKRLQADGDELRLQTGQPVSMRTAEGMRPISDEAMVTEQIVGALGTAGLTHLIPGGNTAGTPTPATVGTQQCQVTVARHGDHIQVRIKVEKPAVSLDAPRPPPSARSPRAIPRLGGPVHGHEPRGQGPATREPTPAPIERSAIPSAVPRDATEPMKVPAPAGSESPGVSRRGSGSYPAADDSGAYAAERSGAHRIAEQPRRRSGAYPVAGGVPETVPAERTPRPRTLSTLRAIRETGDRIKLSRPVSIDRRLRGVLEQAVSAGATDVHISAGQPPMMRLVGRLVGEGEPVVGEDLEVSVRPLLSDAQREQIDTVGHADFAAEVEGVGRLRINVSRQRLGPKVCIRMVDRAPRTLGELGMPPELEKVARYHQGLAVISGPSGQGKTTTMAALVDLLNARKPDHIITVEDPIEIIHPIKRAVISQREVGTHTRSFQAALKGALREDPDVIVIGELRDRETVEMALSAAETGHLVLATMSTPNGAKTIDRLIDLFPPEDQSQVRSTLAGALKMVISQRLVPSADGTRLHAAAELITGNVPLWSLIRDDKLFQLPSLLQRGRGYGMIKVEDSLKELLDAGLITKETARHHADDPRVFEEGVAAPEDSTPRGKAERSGIHDLVGNIFGRKG